MGRFNPKKIEKRLAQFEKEKQDRIKLSLQLKPLLKRIPSEKSLPIEDGILLFGKYKNSKISSLLSSPIDSTYVISYLATNEDLPKEFRKDINDIMDNADPFTDLPEQKISGLKVRQVPGLGMEDDLPW